MGNYLLYPGREEIKAAISALSPAAKKTLRANSTVDHLCIIGALISDPPPGDLVRPDGTLSPHLRQATRATVLRELRGMSRRFFDLAAKVETKGRTTRARSQLAALIRNAHKPTLEAIAEVPLVVGGEQIFPDERYFVAGLVTKLESGAAISAIESRYWGTVVSRAEGVPVRTENLGRAPDRRTQAIANLLARTYRELTGREPTFTVDPYKENQVKGDFPDLVRRIFTILRVGREPLHYASVAARKLRGKGRRK
jgi:hypothetical protein